MRSLSRLGLVAAALLFAAACASETCLNPQTDPPCGQLNPQTDPPPLGVGSGASSGSGGSTSAGASGTTGGSTSSGNTGGTPSATTLQEAAGAGAGGSE